MAAERDLRELVVLLFCLLSAALSSARNTTGVCSSCCAPCTPCPVCPTCTRFIPTGYRYYPGVGHYRLHTTPAIWMDAKKTCEQEGAYLAIVDSQEEYELFEKFLKDDQNLGLFLLIGFHDLYREGTYVTVLGHPLPDKFWWPGEPNNLFNRENCGCFRVGGINDIACDLQLPFVCETNIQTLQPLGFN